MPFQPWAIFAMPQVVWSRANVSASQFEHATTRVDHENAPKSCRRGQTIWWTKLDEQEGAIAWDWVEVREGIVTMVDPMAVLSNIAIGSQVVAVEEQDRLIVLNEWVHQMPWQSVVSAALMRSDH